MIVRVGWEVEMEAGNEWKYVVVVVVSIRLCASYRTCFAASLYLTRWKKVLAQQTTTTTRTMASERARLSRAKYTEDTIWRSVYKAAHLPPCS
jgi:hypothetical protein